MFPNQMVIYDYIEDLTNLNQIYYSTEYNYSIKCRDKWVEGTKTIENLHGRKICACEE